MPDINQLRELIHRLGLQFGGSPPQEEQPAGAGSNYDAQPWQLPSLPTTGGLTPYMPSMGGGGEQTPMQAPPQYGPPQGPALQQLGTAPPPPPQQTPGAFGKPFTPDQAKMRQNVAGYGEVQGGYDEKAKSINMKGMAGPQAVESRRTGVPTSPLYDRMGFVRPETAPTTADPRIANPQSEQAIRMTLLQAQTAKALSDAKHAAALAERDPSLAVEALARFRDFNRAKDTLELAQKELETVGGAGGWFSSETPEHQAAQARVDQAKGAVFGQPSAQAAPAPTPGGEIVIQSEADLTPAMLGKTVVLNGKRFKVTQ